MRQGRLGARDVSAAAEAHANHEEEGEKEVAQQRIAKKHPGGRGAIAGETQRDRLN